MTNLIVVPPRRQDGVASMLVALGDAGIEVSEVESGVDDTGMYRLTVQGDPEFAMRILEAIGCRASHPASRSNGIRDHRLP